MPPVLRPGETRGSGMGRSRASLNRSSGNEIGKEISIPLGPSIGVAPWTRILGGAYFRGPLAFAADGRMREGALLLGRDGGGATTAETPLLGAEGAGFDRMDAGGGERAWDLMEPTAGDRPWGRTESACDCRAWGLPEPTGGLRA